MALVLMCGLAVGAGNAAAKRGDKAPDLKVAKATLKSGSLQPRSKLAVRVKVKNTGKRKARPSHIGLVLSVDRKHKRGDAKLAAKRLGKLKRREAKAVTIRTKLPKRGTGKRKLLACADLRRKVRERKEGNNCKPVREPRGAGPGTFPLKPDPLEVTATPEPAQARSLSVHPVLGGRLQATGTDGTTYTLEIPAHALLARETITMTPIASISDSPVSPGKLGAVEIEPHGLQLQQPATLTIEPSGEVPSSGRTAFTYDGGGGDLHAYPLQPGTGLQLELAHFSTFGAAVASGPQLAELARRVAAKPRAQYQQLAADLINRAHAEGGFDDAILRELTDLAVDYYDDIVAPQLEQALANPGDDARVQAAIRELLAWERQMQLLSLTDDEEIRRRSERVLEQVVELLQRAYEEAFRRCTDEHVLEQIPTLAGLARSLALLGHSPDRGFLEALEACARFEVKLDARFFGNSEQTSTGGDRTVEVDWDYHVATERIPVGATWGAVTQWGDAHWLPGFSYLRTTTQRSSNGDDCVNREEGLQTHPGEVGIKLEPYRNVYDPAPGAPAPGWSFQVEVEPGAYSADRFNRGPYETYRATTLCGAEWGANSPFEAARWGGEMDSFHRERTIPLDSEAPGGDLIATASIATDEPVTGARRSGTRSERTRVELWHAPAP